jgi:hypothetical protein
MLNELQFYEIDTEYLGDESGDEDEEGDVPPPPDGFEGYPGMEYSLN